jgi:hypothetical protein
MPDFRGNVSNVREKSFTIDGKYFTVGKNKQEILALLNNKITDGTFVEGKYSEFKPEDTTLNMVQSITVDGVEYGKKKKESSNNNGTGSVSSSGSPAMQVGPTLKGFYNEIYLAIFEQALKESQVGNLLGNEEACRKICKQTAELASLATFTADQDFHKKFK